MTLCTPQSHLLIMSSLGVRVATHEFWRNTNIQSYKDVRCIFLFFPSCHCFWSSRKSKCRLLWFYKVFEFQLIVYSLLLLLSTSLHLNICLVSFSTVCLGLPFVIRFGLHPCSHRNKQWHCRVLLVCPLTQSVIPTGPWIFSNLKPVRCFWDSWYCWKSSQLSPLLFAVAT